MKERCLWLALPLSAALLTVVPAGAQLSYSKGQSVYAAYEGWEQNPDGS